MGDAATPERTMCPRSVEYLDELAHELWASAQLTPGEGILHGVHRIMEVLAREYGLEMMAEEAPDPGK